LAVLAACAALAGPASAGTAEPPAAVALALETAADRLADRVELAQALFQGLPRGSRLAVFAFDARVEAALPPTDDAAAVDASLAAIQPGTGSPALHDALHAAIAALRELPARRKAVVLLASGRDGSSSRRLEDALAAAQAAVIPVFAVGPSDPPSALRRIARITGGAFATLEEASGFEIAGRIFGLQARGPVPGPGATGAGGTPTPAAVVSPAGGAAPAVPAIAAVTPTTGTAPGAVSRGWPPATLLAPLAAVAAASLAAIGIGLRRRRNPPRPRERRAPEGTVLMPYADQQPPARTRLLRVQPRLEVVAGGEAGRCWTLALPATIGRAADSDIVIEDSRVSAQHCRIREADGRCILEDLQSSNGSYVNGQRVRRHPLRGGDEIGLGGARLRFLEH
jgi:hypothetical protein